MKKLAVAAALLLATCLALAVACGRYGTPQRAERPSRAVEAVPVTDPAVAP